MSWKRRAAAAMFVAGLGARLHATLAEDAAPKKDDATAVPAEAPKKKDPFFGDHFAMYLETRGGSASIDTIRNPLTSGAQQNSRTELNFNGSKTGQFTIGWTLPRGRGQYLLTYNAIADGDFELDATGLQQRYVALGGYGFVTPRSLLPWWQVTVRDGQLQTTETPPVWDKGSDDANGDGVPDADEVRFLSPPALTIGTTVPKDLGNRIQTWDLYYRREFGGVRIRTRWTAGLRYLSYEGAIITPAWLTGEPGSVSGFGYSDGVQNQMLLIQQSTSGWGPVGSGDIQFNFFHQRLTLYGEAKAALIIETLDADSGAFTFYAHDPVASGGNFVFPGSGRIQSNVSKSSWNTMVEVGIRLRLSDGFHIIADWNKAGYLDTMLIPVDLSIPVNASQLALGTTARFVSRDFVVSSVNLGLSFQF